MFVQRSFLDDISSIKEVVEMTKKHHPDARIKKSSWKWCIETDLLKVICDCRVKVKRSGFLLVDWKMPTNLEYFRLFYDSCEPIEVILKLNQNFSCMRHRANQWFSYAWFIFPINQLALHRIILWRNRKYQLVNHFNIRLISSINTTHPGLMVS